MATRIYEFQVTVPAGTPQATPQVTPWNTKDAYVLTLELVIPPGHNGLTGIRIMKGDVTLIPYSPGQYIIGNAYTNTFPIGDYIPTGDVSVQTFNNGAYPHTFYLRWTVSDYNPLAASSSGTPSQGITVTPITTPPDPLSPDAILGPVITDQLVNGQVTADELAGVETENLTVPPAPVPKGL